MKYLTHMTMMRGYDTPFPSPLSIVRICAVSIYKKNIWKGD
jgi:hypothetical protein